MTGQELKHRVDSMRQTLVGAVPSPAGQIDQITYALIYKFMNDIDDKAAALGGKRTYFVGDFEKYNWHTLMSPSLGAYERLALYKEALEKMSKNNNLPELFREIYQNAFLPFNNATILTMLLKEIDYFEHGYGDDIGDVYEYLLSITGAQGDVGQFRTPRHIIDFIVEAIAPTKSDTVLDPACGTAGFLISAYNYVKQHNRKDNTTGENDNNEKSLSSDERDKFYHNYHGFDIDPTMVRTARVNMYLHGFSTPDIKNHDTLSNDDYWGKQYDIILANPPFMSPKGGITPHKKFGVESNRAEVLFVDYIASHLKPTGRAGVIVPEGIIFQSGNAYKELRKNLVENYLYAVISLPAGVFNPYSGVKTSILLLDKELAKKTDKILFIKIQNDGLSLGAQRKEVSNNEIPQAINLIKEFQDGKDIISELAFEVNRDKIAKSGDYNLSGDRYRVFTDHSNSKWPMVKLGDICDVYQSKTITSNEIKEFGKYKVFGANGVIGYFDEYNHEDAQVAVTCRGATCGTVNFTEPMSWITGNAMVIKPKDNSLNKRFLYYLLRSTDLSSVISGSAQPQITGFALKPFKIPLPTLEIQNQIVTELDGYAGIIAGAKQIAQNWKPKIDIDQDWEKVKLGVVAGINEKTINISESKEYNYIDISSVENETGHIAIKDTILGKDLPSRARRQVVVGDVLLSTVRPNLKAFVYIKELPENPVASTGFAVISAKDKVIGLWIYFLSLSDYLQAQMIAQMGKGAYPSINQTDVQNLEIPLPSLAIQKQIAEKIEAECALVESSKKLIEIYEQKTKETIAKLWEK